MTARARTDTDRLLSDADLVFCGAAVVAVIASLIMFVTNVWVTVPAARHLRQAGLS
jgi:hypothetical protein